MANINPTLCQVFAGVGHCVTLTGFLGYEIRGGADVFAKISLTIDVNKLN